MGSFISNLTGAQIEEILNRSIATWKSLLGIANLKTAQIINPNDLPIGIYSNEYTDGTQTTKHLVVKTEEETRILLKLYKGRYLGKYYVYNESGTIITGKSTPEVNTANFTSTITKDSTGIYIITIPVTSSVKRSVQLWIDSYENPLFNIRGFLYATGHIEVHFYKNGIHADPDTDTIINFRLNLEWY